MKLAELSHSLLGVVFGVVPSVGFKYVLVNSTIVVEDGASVAGTFPGVGVRRSSERRTP